jgi:hypothetical protein
LATINPKRKKFTTKEQVDYLNRVIKRMNRAAGYDTAKKPSQWRYEIDGNLGTVEAFTRSEARAEIKKAIGHKGRLPKSLKLEKVHDPNTAAQYTDIGNPGAVFPAVEDQSDCGAEGDTESRSPRPEIIP